MTDNEEVIRAQERERIAVEIENELVCGCGGHEIHGRFICHWGTAAARIARRNDKERRQ